jgi:hypothetical protein
VGLRAWSCHSESVAVQVLQVALSPCKAFFVHGNPEFGRDGVDVLEVQMDERVRSSITLVLGEVKPDTCTRDGDEQRETGLELMLPLFAETQALVPGNSTSRVLDVQDRDDLFVHDAQRIQPSEPSLATGQSGGPVFGNVTRVCGSYR